MSGLVRRALSWQDAGGMGMLAGVSALVSGVTALALAAVLLLVGVYDGWKLAQVQSLFVYVSADADPAALDAAMAELRGMPAVAQVRVVDEATVRAELAAFGPLVAELPLPKVVAVELAAAVNDGLKAQVVAAVKGKFAYAEVDDASATLANVAQGVRLSVRAGAVLVLGMVLVLGGVMVVTVRAGLRAKQATMKLLLQLGARDLALVALAVRGVWGRLVAGWLLGSGLAALGLVASATAWPALGALVTWAVWLCVLAVPLVLVLVGAVTAALVASYEVRRLA